MPSTQRVNFSKITQVAILGIIAAVISTTVYAQNSENGSITSVQIPTQSTDTKIGKINTRVATGEAQLTIRTIDWQTQMASREAELKTKLQTFKNKQKADIVQRVSTNLNTINKNETDRMLKNLDSMSNILDKLETAVNTNIANIKNPSEASTIIASARQTIATTSAAVNVQAQKDYTIQVSSESTAKSNAQAKRNLLFNDLRVVRKDMIDAKESVYKVLRIAKLGNIIKEGTNSATNN